MFKLFEWMGSFIAILCLMEIIHDPKQALRDIQNGPAPHLAEFNDQLMGTGRYKRKIHKLDPSKPLSKQSKNF